jgi:hypothetical protein
MVIFFRRKSNSLGFKSSGEQGVREVKKYCGRKLPYKRAKIY